MDWKDKLKEILIPQIVKPGHLIIADISNGIYNGSINYLRSRGDYVCILPSCNKFYFCFIEKRVYEDVVLNCWADYYIYSDFIVNKYTGNVLKDRFGDKGRIMTS